MIIQNISLTGFNTDTTLTDSQNAHSLVSLRGEQKIYFFESILAILFGMTAEEKQHYRNPSGDIKTHTGRLTLKFDTFTLYVERDFETDIIAVMSESEKGIKPVYQGKDIPGSDDHNAYQELMESVFTLVDKQAIRELCKERLQNESVPLGDVLEIFYTYMRPKYTIAYMERILQRTGHVLTRFQASDARNGRDTLVLKNKLNLLKDLRILTQAQNQIARDLEKMGHIKPKKQEDSVDHILKQRFPTLYTFNAETVYNEAQLFLEKQAIYRRYQKTLNDLMARKASLKKLIHTKLIAYSNLPDTFEEDFHTYQELTLDLADEKNSYDKFNMRISDNQEQINRLKKMRMILALSIPALLLLLIIFFPQLTFGLATASVAALVSIIFLYKLQLDSRRREIDFFQEKQFRIRTRIKSIEEKIYRLREKSFLLDDLRLIDSHIENFHNYKKTQKSINLLSKKITQIKTEISELPLAEMERIDKKYKDKIDWNRADLLSYLKTFKTIQSQTGKKGFTAAEKNDPLREAAEQYSHLLVKIEEMRQKLIGKVQPPTTNGELDVAIKSLERFIRHTQLENLN